MVCCVCYWFVFLFIVLVCVCDVWGDWWWMLRWSSSCGCSLDGGVVLVVGWFLCMWFWICWDLVGLWGIDWLVFDWWGCCLWILVYWCVWLVCLCCVFFMCCDWCWDSWRMFFCFMGSVLVWWLVWMLILIGIVLDDVMWVLVCCVCLLSGWRCWVVCCWLVVWLWWVCVVCLLCMILFGSVLIMVFWLYWCRSLCWCWSFMYWFCLVCLCCVGLYWVLWVWCCVVLCIVVCWFWLWMFCWYLWVWWDRIVLVCGCVWFVVVGILRILLVGWWLLNCDGRSVVCCCGMYVRKWVWVWWFVFG